MRKLTIRPTVVFPPGAILDGADLAQIRGDVDEWAERYHHERGAREVAEAERDQLAADLTALQARLDEPCTECARLEVQVLPNLGDYLTAPFDEPIPDGADADIPDPWPDVDGDRAGDHGTWERIPSRGQVQP